MSLLLAVIAVINIGLSGVQLVSAGSVANTIDLCSDKTDVIVDDYLRYSQSIVSGNNCHFVGAQDGDQTSEQSQTLAFQIASDDSFPTQIELRGCTFSHVQIRIDTALVDPSRSKPLTFIVDGGSMEASSPEIMSMISFEPSTGMYGSGKGHMLPKESSIIIRKVDFSYSPVSESPSEFGFLYFGTSLLNYTNVEMVVRENKVTLDTDAANDGSLYPLVLFITLDNDRNPVPVGFSEGVSITVEKNAVVSSFASRDASSHFSFVRFNLLGEFFGGGNGVARGPGDVNNMNSISVSHNTISASGVALLFSSADPEEGKFVTSNTVAAVTFAFGGFSVFGADKPDGSASVNNITVSNNTIESDGIGIQAAVLVHGVTFRMSGRHSYLMVRKNYVLADLDSIANAGDPLLMTGGLVVTEGLLEIVGGGEPAMPTVEDAIQKRVVDSTTVEIEAEHGGTAGPFLWIEFSSIFASVSEFADVGSFYVKYCVGVLLIHHSVPDDADVIAKVGLRMVGVSFSSALSSSPIAESTSSNTQLKMTDNFVDTSGVVGVGSVSTEATHIGILVMPTCKLVIEGSSEEILVSAGTLLVGEEVKNLVNVSYASTPVVSFIHLSNNHLSVTLRHDPNYDDDNVPMALGFIAVGSILTNNITIGGGGVGGEVILPHPRVAETYITKQKSLISIDSEFVTVDAEGVGTVQVATLFCEGSLFVGGRNTSAATGISPVKSIPPPSPSSYLFSPSILVRSISIDVASVGNKSESGGNYFKNPNRFTTQELHVEFVFVSAAPSHALESESTVIFEEGTSLLILSSFLSRLGDLCAMTSRHSLLTIRTTETKLEKNSLILIIDNWLNAALGGLHDTVELQPMFDLVFIEARTRFVMSGSLVKGSSNSSDDRYSFASLTIKDNFLNVEAMNKGKDSAGASVDVSVVTSGYVDGLLITAAKMTFDEAGRGSSSSSSSSASIDLFPFIVVQHNTIGAFSVGVVSAYVLDVDLLSEVHYDPRGFEAGIPTVLLEENSLNVSDDFLSDPDPTDDVDIVVGVANLLIEPKPIVDLTQGAKNNFLIGLCSNDFNSDAKLGAKRLYCSTPPEGLIQDGHSTDGFIDCKKDIFSTLDRCKEDAVPTHTLTEKDMTRALTTAVPATPTIAIEDTDAMVPSHSVSESEFATTHQTIGISDALASSATPSPFASPTLSLHVGCPTNCANVSIVGGSGGGGVNSAGNASASGCGEASLPHAAWSKGGGDVTKNFPPEFVLKDGAETALIELSWLNAIDVIRVENGANGTATSNNTVVSVAGWGPRAGHRGQELGHRGGVALACSIHFGDVSTDIAAEERLKSHRVTVILHFGCHQASPIHVSFLLLPPPPPAPVLSAPVETASVVASLLSLTAGGGAAGAAADMQTLATLGLSSCAKGSAKSRSGLSLRSLAPFAISDSCEGAVIGNFITVIVLLSIHLMVGVWGFRRQTERIAKKGQVPTNPLDGIEESKIDLAIGIDGEITVDTGRGEKGAAETTLSSSSKKSSAFRWMSAFDAAHFPALSLTVIMFLQNGFFLCGFDLLRNGGAEDGGGNGRYGSKTAMVALGYVSVVWTIVPLLVFIIIASRLSSRAYYSVYYRIRFAWQSVIVFLLLPHGAFDRSVVGTQMFASVIGKYKYPQWPCVFCSFFSFIAAAPITIGTGSSCMLLYGISVGLHLIFAAILVFIRPFPVSLTNVMTPLSMVLNAVIIVHYSVILDTSYSVSDSVGTSLGILASLQTTAAVVRFVQMATQRLLGASFVQSACFGIVPRPYTSSCEWEVSNWPFEKGQHVFYNIRSSRADFNEEELQQLVVVMMEEEKKARRAEEDVLLLDSSIEDLGVELLTEAPPKPDSSPPPPHTEVDAHHHRGRHAVRQKKRNKSKETPPRQQVNANNACAAKPRRRSRLSVQQALLLLEMPSSSSSSSSASSSSSSSLHLLSDREDAASSGIGSGCSDSDSSSGHVA